MEDEQDQFAEHFNSAQAERAAVTAPAPAPATEAAAPAAPSEQTPAEAPAPAAEAPAAPAEPVSLDELQARLADLQQRERSSAGRVSVFMRKNDELEKLVAEMRDKMNKLSAPAPAPTPAPAPVDDVLSAAPDLDAAVARRVSDALDPLLKRVTDAEGRVETMSRVTQEVREVVNPISEQKLKDTIAKTHEALDENFTKQWRTDVNSPAYAEWLETQDDAVKHQALHAVTVEDTSAVLARYYARKGFPQRTAAPAPAPAADPQQRLRLAAGIAPRGSPRAPAGPADDDFEGHFAAAAAARKTA